MLEPKKYNKRICEAQVHWAHLKAEQLIWTSCILCGSPNYETLGALVINWIEFFLVQCPTCRLIWRNPLPDPGFLKDLYSEFYYRVAKDSPSLVYQVGIADCERSDQEKRREITRREVCEWKQRGIIPTTPSGERKNLLEIGGGRGYLQQAASEAGWNTLGLEISAHGIKAAIEKGLIVLPITLEELCEKFIPYHRYFDAVVFFDFLEHVMDPGKVLRMVKYIIKEDGIIILRVPITEECPRLHLIDHIWHFSAMSIRKLLAKEGLEIVDSHDSGSFKAPSGDSIENLTIFAKKDSTN